MAQCTFPNSNNFILQTTGLPRCARPQTTTTARSHPHRPNGGITCAAGDEWTSLRLPPSTTYHFLFSFSPLFFSLFFLSLFLCGGEESSPSFFLGGFPGSSESIEPYRCPPYGRVALSTVLLHLLTIPLTCVGHAARPPTGFWTPRRSLVAIGTLRSEGPASVSGTIVPVPARAHAAGRTHCHVDRSDPGRVRRWLVVATCMR
ncbi:unnamed protein product [Ixodes persulcatus]